MKALLFILGFIVLVGSYLPLHADERSAVRGVQSKLVQIGREPRLINDLEAHSVLVQKLAQLQGVDVQIQNMLQVILNPALRQALTSAQNLLQRLSQTPMNDPTWANVYLGDVVRTANQAAAVLNVSSQAKSGDPGCIEDVLSNPLRGDTL